MEQPPKIPENDEEREDEIGEKEEEIHTTEESLEKVEDSHRISIPEENKEELEHEKEAIRTRLEQGSENSLRGETPREEKRSPESSSGDEEEVAEPKRHRGGGTSIRPSVTRGFFGLIFMWFFNGVKKSFGGKVETGHGSSGGAKKPSGGGHGGGGGGHH